MLGHRFIFIRKDVKRVQNTNNCLDDADHRIGQPECRETHEQSQNWNQKAKNVEILLHFSGATPTSHLSTSSKPQSKIYEMIKINL